MGLHILVLAGGSGTRLWPLSRQATPKHLLPLGPGGSTLLRATVERVADLGDSVAVVTAAAQADLCRAALQGIARIEFIAEPEARGTGPALGLATRQIARDDPEAIVVSVHADAYVGDVQSYRDSILAAAGWALATGGLSTVGLTPTYAATGLGYIALGQRHDSTEWSQPTNAASADGAERARTLGAYRSMGFVEKPPLAAAEEYLADGRHLWNLGLFAWPAAVFETELRAANPILADALTEMVEYRAAGDDHAAAAVYARLTPVPVEPLVFERTPQLTVVQATYAWSDLGSWKDLRDVRVQSGEADEEGNIIDGNAAVVGSRNCLVYAHGGRRVTVAAGEDLVVVDTGDAVMVVPAAEAQRVKDVVDGLRQSQQSDLL